MFFSEVTTSEYNPYFKAYLSKVGDAPLVQSLETGMLVTKAFFESLPEGKQQFVYAPGKWTPKEILAHLIDSERMFCFRALTIARTDNVDMPGFDENEFARNAGANARSMDSLVNEYLAVRLATVHLFKNFSDDTLKREGLANGHTLSVRAAGFIICGHEKHHRTIITERYLSL